MLRELFSESFSFLVMRRRDGGEDSAWRRREDRSEPGIYTVNGRVISQSPDHQA